MSGPRVIGPHVWVDPFYPDTHQTIQDLKLCRQCGLPREAQPHWKVIAEGLSTHEPMPVVNDRTAIQDLVIADIAERKRVGIERYGTPLQAFNGRNALVDAYQEALDLVMYLRQMIEEQAAG